jgi:hypothetical protein
VLIKFEVYVKRFVGLVLVLRSVLFEEVRVSHICLEADYGVENIVIEAEAPCGRVKDREVKKYMKSYTLALLA